MKTLNIKAKNQGENNIYVRSVSINGKLLPGTTLTHDDIMQGGELIFEMSNTP